MKFVLTNSLAYVALLTTEELQDRKKIYNYQRCYSQSRRFQLGKQYVIFPFKVYMDDFAGFAVFERNQTTYCPLERDQLESWQCHHVEPPSIGGYTLMDNGLILWQISYEYSDSDYWMRLRNMRLIIRKSKLSK